MADLTVKKLAEIVGFSSGKLLSRMKEANLKHASEEEIVTDKDRKKLLEHLKNPEFKKTSTISLKKKTKEKEVSQVSNKIEIQRKNKIKTTSSVDKSDDSDSIDFKSAEAKRKANEQEKANAKEKEKVDKKVDVLGKTKVRRTSKKDESATSKKIPVDTKKNSSSRISKREERELEGERILELKLNSIEKKQFLNSVKAVKNLTNLAQTLVNKK